jgi:rod shape-determining protein MreD
VRLNNHQSFLLSVMLAMGLRILPLPPPANVLNPDWVLLILIYWTLMQPYRQGLFHAWTVGLLTDVLMGRTLGEYALIYAIISYFCLKFHKQLRQYPFIQQSLFIFSCLLTAQMLVFLLESIQHPTVFSGAFWLPVFTGTLAWRLIDRLLYFLRHLGHLHSS